MEVSLFLARFLGGFYVIVGILSITTRFLGRVIEKTDDENFVVSTGYISLLMGLATVAAHNIWVADWRVAITILGWGTLIKGMLKIGYPNVIHKQAQMFKKQQALESVILMLLGAWLLWVSF